MRYRIEVKPQALNGNGKLKPREFNFLQVGAGLHYYGRGEYIDSPAHGFCLWRCQVA